jgi:spermidine synthase
MTKRTRRAIPDFLEQLQPDYPANPYVYDDKSTRSLYFSCIAVQSSMRLSDPFELELGYTQTMMGFLLFNAEPKHILIVGLGGGSLSKYCYHQFPQARITTVEINSEVIALRDEFMIPCDDERFQIVHADASDYLATNDIQADIILLDGYDAAGLPECLSSDAFYSDCRRALSKYGVLVANLWGSNLDRLVYLKRLRGTFNTQVWCSKAFDSSNWIAFIVKRTNFFAHCHKLMSKAHTLDERYRLNLSWVAENLCQHPDQYLD